MTARERRRYDNIAADAKCVSIAYRREFLHDYRRDAAHRHGSATMAPRAYSIARFTPTSIGHYGERWRYARLRCSRCRVADIASAAVLTARFDIRIIRFRRLNDSLRRP